MNQEIKELPSGRKLKIIWQEDEDTVSTYTDNEEDGD
jgi:hypothetical protein